MIFFCTTLLQATVLYALAGVVQAQSPDLPRAFDLVAKGEFDAAGEVLEKYLKLHPGNADALNLMGIVAAEQGKPDAAKSWFEKALKANPKLAEAYTNLGRLYLKQGQLDVALDFFNRAAKAAPGDPEALLNAAILLADQKRYEEAIQALKKIPEKSRTQPHWETLGKMQLAAGNPVEAEHSYEKVLALDPESVETLRTLSGLAMKRGDTRAAWDYISKARQLAPNSGQILYEYGYIGLADRHVRDAVLSFRRAIMMDDKRPEYYGGLIDALMRTTDYPMAAEAVEKYIQMRPEDPWGYYVKGWLIFLAGKLDESVPFLARAAEMDPKQADPLHLLGRVAYDKGDNSRAEQYFQQAIQNKPDHAEAWLRLGMVHMREQKYELAEKELRRSAELDPRASTTHLQLSMLLARIGKMEEATKEAELHKKLKAEESQRIEDAAVTSSGAPVKK